MDDKSPGFIAPGHVYLATEVRSRLRIGTWAWRTMRRNGLKVRYFGRRAYVFGDDVIDFFHKQDSDEGGSK
jgi:hypothetical protein